MKIVYFISSLNDSGGMQRVLSLKANYLTDILGHEVTIVTIENGQGNGFFQFSPKIKIIDLGVAYTGSNYLNMVINRLRQSRLLKKRLKEVLFDLKPDIAISMFQNEAPFLPSIKDGSVKIIESHICRYYRLYKEKKFIPRLIAKIRAYNNANIVKKYDAFVTLTNEDKRDWSSLDNIHVIPNPITIKCDKLAQFSGKRVIAVGRMTYQKGFDNLIKVWSIVEQKHPDWELVIVGSQGDVPYVNYIKDLIKELALKCVVLKSTTKAIEEEYLQSNILVMTSNYEGFGLVLIEGMSVGLPLVAFDCKCGPMDIINDGGNGFLVEDKNIEMFADRACQIIEDKRQHARMSAEAIENSKNYELEHIMQKWTSLFDKLLERKR